jgi:hypothetical protein
LKDHLHLLRVRKSTITHALEDPRHFNDAWFRQLRIVVRPGSWKEQGSRPSHYFDVGVIGAGDLWGDQCATHHCREIDTNGWLDEDKVSVDCTVALPVGTRVKGDDGHRSIVFRGRLQTAEKLSGSLSG